MSRLSARIVRVRGHGLQVTWQRTLALRAPDKLGDRARQAMNHT
jgi:hypothetical protein